MRSQLHLVECHCFLPQYKNRPNPVYHKFLVHSVIDDGDTVVPKFVQCNNCGVIHNVIDVCKSEIISGREDIVLLSKEDITLMIPSSIANILNQYNCELPLWEKALWIFQEEKFGESVVIDKKENEEEVSGKRLTIESIQKFTIEPFFYKKTVG